MKEQEPNRPGGPGKHRQPKKPKAKLFGEHFKVDAEEKQIIARAAKHVKYSKYLWFKELVLEDAHRILRKYEG